MTPRPRTGRSPPFRTTRWAHQIPHRADRTGTSPRTIAAAPRSSPARSPKKIQNFMEILHNDP